MKKIAVTILVLLVLFISFEVYRLALNLGYNKEEPSLPPSHGYARFEIAEYKVVFKEYPNLTVSYGFSEEYADSWIDIQNGIRTHISNFIVSDFNFNRG